MCGLITVISKSDQPINEAVMNQFEDQIQRGEKGFGSLMIDKDKKIKVLRATEKTKALLDLYMNPSQFIMFHHRFPTSSENKISQTHPILVSNKALKYAYYVTHNGVISNDDELKEEHEGIGFKYITERNKSLSLTEYNDSECFAIELARYMEGLVTEVGATGSIAFVAVKANKKSGKAISLIYGRTTNPLNMTNDEHHIMLSSEGPGDEIEANIIYEYNLETIKTTAMDFKVKKYEYKYPAYNNQIGTPYKPQTKLPYSGYSRMELPDKKNPVTVKTPAGFKDEDATTYTPGEDPYAEDDDGDSLELQYIDAIIDTFLADIRDTDYVAKHDMQSIIDSAVMQIRDELEVIATRAEFDNSKSEATKETAYKY
jgi:ribosomal protein L25 (general stress protein Ctc)